MSLFRVLLKLWKGDILKEEKEATQKVHNESRRAIEDTRAMLDGEDGWLIPDKRKCRHGGE